MQENNLKVNALSWLYEMEVLQSPTLLTNLRENVLLTSKRISKCEFLVFEDRKDILILIHLDWIGRTFSNKNKILEQVKVITQEILPFCRIKVTYDPLEFKKIKELADSIYK